MGQALAIAHQKASNIPLQSVSYQVSQERVVTSTTAKVNVLLNATVPSKSINKLQALAKAELERIVPKVDWNIDRYRQHKLPSGMIAIDMNLSSRVSSQVLSKITDSLAGINKSGYRYTVSAIDYTPSNMQIEQAKESMRLAILSRISNQVKAVSKQMHLRYVVKSVVFDPRYLPSERNSEHMSLYAAGDAIGNGKPMSISYKVHMGAAVVLAAKCALLNSHTKVSQSVDKKESLAQGITPRF